MALNEKKVKCLENLLSVKVACSYVENNKNEKLDPKMVKEKVNEVINILNGMYVN